MKINSIAPRNLCASFTGAVMLLLMLSGFSIISCNNENTADPEVAVEINESTAGLKGPIDCPSGTRIIRGTPDNDTIVGTNGSDCILGNGGNDLVDGRGGNDTIFGGLGDDTIIGGSGRDAVYGEEGNDVIQSGDLLDTVLSGGSGNDVIVAPYRGSIRYVVNGGDGTDACTVSAPGCEQVAQRCDNSGDCANGSFCLESANVCVTCISGENCADGDACTKEICNGYTMCSHSPISTCITGDGCCPEGCETDGDNDCSPLCGNDAIDPGETCDPPASCPTDCDDDNTCTDDILTGSAETCDAECNHTEIVSCDSGDGCCPAGCNANTDSDCEPVCGNDVLEAGEDCDPLDSCPTACDDNNTCTLDELSGSLEDCTAVCEFTAIVACVTGDDCCPASCNEFLDGDCPSTILPFIANELVGRPTDHSITVNVMAGQSMEAYVEFGTISGEYTGTTAPADYSDGIVETVVDHLEADTRYYYRLRYRPGNSLVPFLAGDEHTFHTQRDVDSPFTFAVQSDSHQGYASFYDDALYRTTMSNISNAHPDFILDLGDTVSTDDATETEETVRQKYLNQRTVFDIAGHSSPVFLALGNHENEEGWNLDDFGASNVANSLPVLGANSRKRFFLNPIPDDFYTGNEDDKSRIFDYPAVDGDGLLEDYYAFEWGGALFVVIDPYWYTMTKPFAGSMGGEKNDETAIGNRWDWTLGVAQYEWLKDTLRSSNARYKFVFAHHHTGGTSDYVRAGAFGASLCEWGGYDLDGATWAFDRYRPGWEMPIHQLLVQTGVTAFFHGHDHVFAYETLDGIVYQELPHAANAGYEGGFTDNPDNYPRAHLENNSGYVRVHVAPEAATVEYVRSYLPGDGDNDSVTYAYPMYPCDVRDSDDDGTMDCWDRCPSDALKTEPGQCGCNQPDVDSDGDGIMDCMDGCSDDAQKTKPGICRCGVPDDETCLADTFAVVRVGSGGAALSVASTPAFIELRNIVDGSLVSSFALPTEASGNNQPLTLSGGANREGALRRSADGRFLTVAGYAVGPGTANVYLTPSSPPTDDGIPRVAALISLVPYEGAVMDTTTLFSGAFNGNNSNTNPANPRSAVTVDGSGFWVVGGGAGTTGGMWYAPRGNPTSVLPTQIFTVTGTNQLGVWTCDIFDGQLYGTAKTTTPSLYGVFNVGTGLPLTTTDPTMLAGSSGASPLDFVMMDRDPEIEGVDTIYIADETANSGGIKKWTFNGTVWSEVAFSTGITTGIRHLSAVESPEGVILLGTTAGAANASNAIVKVVDTGSAASFSPLVSAPTNTAFRGLALPPSL